MWGLWLDETCYFSTDPASRKGTNLHANPEIVVHLESGDDVVILEGAAHSVSDASMLTRFADVYQAKYQFRPDPADPGQAAYAVQPRTAFAWLEKDFPKSATRWRFDQE